MNTLRDTDEGRPRPDVWPVYVALLLAAVGFLVVLLFGCGKEEQKHTPALRNNHAHEELSRLRSEWEQEHRQKVYDDRMKQANELIREDPEDPRGYQDAAAALLLTGRNEEAKQHLLKAADLARGDSEVLRLCALRLSSGGHHDDAVKCLRQAKVLAPDSEYIWCLLVEALGRSSDKSGAMVEAKAGVAKYPDNERLRLFYAAQLVDQEELREAKLVLLEGQSSWHKHYASMWERVESMTEAAQEGHSRALPAPPCGPVSATIGVMQDYLHGQAGYYRLLATSNMRPEQLESASYWLATALQATDRPRDHVWLGDLLSATGEVDEARRTYLTVSSELSEHVLARLKRLDAVGEEQFKEQMKAFVLANWRTYYTGQEVPMWK